MLCYVMTTSHSPGVSSNVTVLLRGTVAKGQWRVKREILNYNIKFSLIGVITINVCNLLLSSPLTRSSDTIGSERSLNLRSEDLRLLDRYQAKESAVHT